MFTAYIMTEENPKWRLETANDEIVRHSGEGVEDEKAKACTNAGECSLGQNAGALCDGN